MNTPEAWAAMMADWLERQKAVFDSLSPRGKQQAENRPSENATPRAEEVCNSYMDFWTTFAKAMPAQPGALDGGALETLVDPAAGARNSLGPPDPKTRLASAPSFATLWDWDQKTLKAYAAWIDLQQAIAAQRSLVDAAWVNAAGRFQRLIVRPVDDAHPPITSWRAGLDLWLATANTCLLELQRSDEFLEAQRGLLSSSMDYRLKLKDIAEELCELYQVPGRNEVDELARLVHELRREMRALKRASKHSDETRGAS